MTGPARRDVAEIWDYVSQGSERTADAFVHTLIAHMDHLRDFPDSGVARFEFRKALRSSVFRGYTIYYSYSQTEILIVRVLHGRQDASAIFEEE